MSRHIFPASLVLCTAIIILGALIDRHPDNELRAMTAHGTDKKTMATVPLDSSMEAVVTLDHTTGDLTGYVLDRFTGKFFIQYRYNLLQDFPQSQGKFLLASGTADFRQVTGNERFANGVIYVAEEASGQVIAYGLPWNSQARASGAPPQRLSFVALDFAKTRFN